jgi:hypothetical protein
MNQYIPLKEIQNLLDLWYNDKDIIFNSEDYACLDDYVHGEHTKLGRCIEQLEKVKLLKSVNI